MQTYYLISLILFILTSTGSFDSMLYRQQLNKKYVCMFFLSVLFLSMFNLDFSDRIAFFPSTILITSVASIVCIKKKAITSAINTTGIIAVISFLLSVTKNLLPVEYCYLLYFALCFFMNKKAHLCFYCLSVAPMLCVTDFSPPQIIILQLLSSAFAYIIPNLVSLTVLSVKRQSPKA